MCIYSEESEYLSVSLFEDNATTDVLVLSIARRFNMTSARPQPRRTELDATHAHTVVAESI